MAYCGFTKFFVSTGYPRSNSRIVRAHPPLQPGGHGHHPAAVPGRTERRQLRPGRQRALRHPAAGQRGSGRPCYCQRKSILYPE